MKPSRHFSGSAGLLVCAVALTSIWLLALTPAAAQHQQPTPDQIDEELRRQVAEARERLQLTAEQEKQIQPIFEENAKKLREMRVRYRDVERSRENMSAARDEVSELQRKMYEQLQGILTQEQMEEYGKILDERRRERSERLGRRGGRG